MDKLYTISEVADKLGVTPKTLRRWELAGKFSPSRTVGGQRRYSMQDLQILDAIKHKTIPSQDDLLTLSQAAALFGVSPQTINRWENEGKIHTLITSENAFYPKTKLLAQIEMIKSEIASPTTLPEEYPPATIPSESHPPEREISPKSHSVSSSQPNPAPKLSPLTNTTKTSSPTTNLAKAFLPILMINLFLTIMIIAGYHQLTSQPPLNPGIQSQEQVMGATAANSSLKLLDTILDPTGNLTTPGDITTNKSLTVGTHLLLTPIAQPEGVPGTLYFDTGTQSLRIFTAGKWHNFPGATNLPLSNGTIAKSSTTTLAKGKSSTTISDDSITADSSITITFNGNYSPAKKFWVTQSSGSFTLNTDFPVNQSVKFTYLILTPGDGDESPDQDNDTIDEADETEDSSPTESPSPSPDPDSEDPDSEPDI